MIKEELNMKKNFLKFLPLMAAVVLATSCSKDDDANVSQQPEKKDIPFSIKADTDISLSKIAYDDNGKQVNISFSENDVNNLTMKIYSNDPEKDQKYYCDLVLTDINGIFTGNFDSWKVPEEGEELLAVINVSPANANNYSTVSLTDLLTHCDCKYKGTFKYNSSDCPDYTYTEDNMPKVRLTCQKAYFEFYFPNAKNSVGFGWSRLYEGEYYPANNFQTVPISSDHKLWYAMDKDVYKDTDWYYELVIEYDFDVIYKKKNSEIAKGVIYSVTRPQPKN